MDEKEIFIIVTAILIMLYSLPIAASLQVLDEGYQNIYNGDSLEAQAYANIVGESYLYAPSPYSTVLTHQASSYGMSYAEQSFWYDTFSINHKIRVRAIYTPSPLRITDPASGYDDQEYSNVNPVVQYSLNALWSLLMSIGELPGIPSPWGVILQNPPRVTITRDSDYGGTTFRYNAEPQLQSADWLWYIDKPVYTGWYLISVNAQGTVYHWECYEMCDYWPIGDIHITLWAEFEVYR